MTRARGENRFISIVCGKLSVPEWTVGQQFVERTTMAGKVFACDLHKHSGSESQECPQ